LDIPHKKILKKVLKQGVVAQSDLEKYAKIAFKTIRAIKVAPNLLSLFLADYVVNF
jgi:hypothetical protein